MVFNRPASLFVVGLLLVGCATTRDASVQATAEEPALDGILIEPVPVPIAERRVVPPTVWSELRAGFALDHAVDKPQVQAALRWLASQPDLMLDIQPRLERYLPYLVDAVNERKLPAELALVPIIESTLDPYAFSAGGAAGLWQLIPATARYHGVSMNWWYDGRRDPVDATRAALDHLQYLHDRFDDWLLALAAYNAGEGRIRRALARAPEPSFWALRLPDETERYVPRLLAIAHVIAHPSLVDLPTLPVRRTFVVARIDSQVDLTAVARDAKVPIEEIFRFNPGLNRGATPPDGPHRLLLPIVYDAPLRDALGSYPRDAQRWTRYVVRRGDSLSTIARRHHTTVSAIRTSNALSGHLIRVGDTLLIPQAKVNAGTLPENPLLAKPGGRYQVAAGDSLWTISRRYATSVDALVRANRLDPKRPLKVGQTLVVPGKSVDRKIHYRVRRGDSLARIASRFRIRIKDIARWNALDAAEYLQPGQRLVLYVSLADSYS